MNNYKILKVVCNVFNTISEFDERRPNIALGCYNV